MRKTYPLTPHQVELLNSAKRELELAQNTFTAVAAMAMAAAGVAPPCNFAGLQDGAMVVEAPDEEPPAAV